MFRQLDTDMSNTINYNEFKQAFVGASISEKEMRQLFNQLDINSDGEINYEEFLTGVRDQRLANSKAGRMLQKDQVMHILRKKKEQQLI